MALRRALVIIIATFAMTSIAVPAYAYQDELTVDQLNNLPVLKALMTPPGSSEPNWPPDPSAEPIACYYCHGSGESVGTPPSAADQASGPHGNYVTTTTKCATCHTVHAGESPVLLPAATVAATCECCHDGTGAGGVYGVIASYAPGVTVQAAHAIDVTNVIPGGDSAGGSASAGYFAGVDGTLSCNDCHAPHGYDVVDAFDGDRGRSDADGDPDTLVRSSRLLKRRPNPTAAVVTKYGSDWCGSCHVGRLSGSGATGNHPVESSANLPTGGEAAKFYYDRVARLTGASSPGNVVTTTEVASLGHNNFGYVMPVLAGNTRTAQQTGHDPICQQCHEDARHVGDVAGFKRAVHTTEVFTVTAVDGAVATDRPRFQTFPHESQNVRFLVEVNDDLCLNCHKTATGTP